MWVHLAVLRSVIYYITPLSEIFRLFSPVLSSFMTLHRVHKKSNTTGVTSVAGTAYPSGYLGSSSVLSEVRVARTLSL